MDNALNNQIGGNHYKSMQMQPIELIAKLKLNYFQGNIVKYISRNKDNKIEDLKKAKHYCELAIELDKKDFKFLIKIFRLNWKKPVDAIINYRRVNLMDKYVSNIIFEIYFKGYKEAIKEIDKVLSNEIVKQQEINRMCDKKELTPEQKDERIRVMSLQLAKDRIRGNATKGGIEIIAMDNKGIPKELKEEINIITKDYLDTENDIIDIADNHYNKGGVFIPNHKDSV